MIVRTKSRKEPVMAAMLKGRSGGSWASSLADGGQAGGCVSGGICRGSHDVMSS